MIRAALAVPLLSAALLVSAHAGAGTLSTSPVVLQQNVGILCGLANVGEKSVRAVTLEIVEWDTAGISEIVTTSLPEDLEPLGFRQVTDLATSLTPTVGVCRFTFQGSGKTLRASASVLANGGSELLATETAR